MPAFSLLITISLVYLVDLIIMPAFYMLNYFETVELQNFAKKIILMFLLEA